MSGFVPNATHTLRADVPDFDTAHCGPALATFVTSALAWASLYLVLQWTDACAGCARRKTAEPNARKADGLANGNGHSAGVTGTDGGDRNGSSRGWWALGSVCAPYASLDAAKRSLWNSYVVSTVHSVVTLYGGVQSVVADAEGAFDSALLAAFGHSARRDHYLMVTCGYLFYDLLLCCWSYYHYHYRPRHTQQRKGDSGRSGASGSTNSGSSGSSSSAWDPLTVLHHVLIIVAFGGGVWSRIGTIYMCAFLWNELSTVFLNANYFMACNARLKDTAPYRVNGVLLVAAFALFRVLWNGAALYHLLCVTWPVHVPLVWVKAPRFVACAVTLTALAVGHMLLNWLWFGRIVAAATRKLSRKPARASKSNPIATANANANAKQTDGTSPAARDAAADAHADGAAPTAAAEANVPVLRAEHNAQDVVTTD